MSIFKAPSNLLEHMLEIIFTFILLMFFDNCVGNIKKKQHGNDGDAYSNVFFPLQPTAITNSIHLMYVIQTRNILKRNALSGHFQYELVLRPKLSSNAKCNLQNFTCCMLIMFDVQTLFELNPTYIVCSRSIYF